MPIAREALELIIHFEGYHRALSDGTAAPYLCSAGVPTIGFGSIWRLDGSRVEMTDPPITRAEAMALMGREIEGKCLPAIGRLITVPLHPLSEGALASFVFNVGAGALRSSGLRRAINERRWGDVSGEFMKWRMAGGRVLRGLELRRIAEAQMFLRGVNAQRTGTTPVVSGWTTTIRRAA